jgi:hypothetical protein
VAETQTTLVATTPPIVTVGLARKFVPVIVIAVPPAIPPLVGRTEVNVGGVTWVNAAIAVTVPESLLVMTTFLEPAVPAGDRAVIEVAETRTILVAATPPIVTVGVSRKFSPVIVTAVPPAVVPRAGEIAVNIGLTTYRNALAEVTVPESVLVITIFFNPPVPAGVIAVIEVADAQTTLVAATPPIVTVGLARKFVPVMVIAVPPASTQTTGDIEVKVGGVRKVKAPVAVTVPESELVIMMFFDPAVLGGKRAVIEVADTRTTFVAATPSIVTVRVSRKFVPVMVTVVDSAVEPVDGEIETKLGAETADALCAGEKIPIERVRAVKIVRTFLR